MLTINGKERGCSDNTASREAIIASGVNGGAAAPLGDGKVRWWCPDALHGERLDAERDTPTADRMLHETAVPHPLLN